MRGFTTMTEAGSSNLPHWVQGNPKHLLGDGQQTPDFILWCQATTSLGPGPVEAKQRTEP